MADPYQPPETDQNSDLPAQETSVFSKIGLGLYFAPIIGLALTAIAMVSAFSTLAADNSADPSVLAGDISMALVSTAYGLIIGLVGAVILFIQVIKGSFKTRKAFWYMMVLSILYCFSIFGILLGGPMIAVLLIKREQFQPNGAVSPSSIGH